MDSVKYLFIETNNNFKMKKKVDKELLDLYYEYDQEFGLLDEPWASKKDREFFNQYHPNVLEKYIDKLMFIKVENLHSSLRDKTNDEIKELENFIDKEVIDILKKI